MGRRDYAVLMMLAKLGLRADEVATLTLDDIDWRAGEMLVRAKGRQRARMPMPPDVGAAVVAYLRDGRPKSSCRRLFVRTLAPYVGFASGTGDRVRWARPDRPLKAAQIAALVLFRTASPPSCYRYGATLLEIGKLQPGAERDRDPAEGRSRGAAAP